MGALGHGLFWVAGLAMFVFEIYYFLQWWGLGGVIAAVMIPPLASVFPVVYLFMEGFSLLYFGIWAAGLLGMGLAASQR